VARVTAGWMSRSPAGELRPRRVEGNGEEPGIVGRTVERMRPEEGWASLLLVLILAGTMAWSIANARWILGRDSLSSFVIWAAIAAALWGYLSARLEMSRWLAHLLGATIGAFVLIEFVGAQIPDAHPGLVGWFQATANSVTQAYLDLTWRHQLSTSQYGHFGLVVGIIAWGTAQAGSYDVFGYHRAVNGVLLMAVVLIANMAMTLQDQFPALVLFSGAALALLLLAHAADERSSWLRHRIWRGGDLHAPHAQGGLGFASVAICGALFLTSVASAAPLAAPLQDASGNFRDFGTWISNFLPNGGQSRISPGGDFGTSTTIGSAFHAGTDNAFTVKLPDALANSRWRVIAYDQFQVTGWSVGSGPAQTEIAANSPLNGGTLDLVSSVTAGRNEFQYVIHIQDSSIRHLIVANEPGVTDVPTGRVLVGSSPSDADVVWFPTDATDYSITAYVPNVDPTGAGLTEWRLRHAGTAYPTGIVARYTQGAELVGSDGQYLLQLIKQWAPTQGYVINPKTGRFANEYDAAKAIQDYLRDPDHFTYNTNIGDIVRQCASLSTVDCFALFREGFCEQYATTMTMLMRMDGFPARYVLGYLPGNLEQHALMEQVTAQQRHAWVEVYFPSYGWIPFDPTGGSVGQPTELPAGSEVKASPTPSSGLEPGRTRAPRVTPWEGGGGSTTNSTDNGGPGGMLLPAVISFVVLLALILLWRWRPRRLQGPDAVYRGVVKLASRLGYKPLPTQTVYEYTGMLADLVPRAMDPLGIVAMAEVEVTYGRRQLPTDRLISLAAAQRRVRQALLRLVFRIPGRGPRPPKKGRVRPR
jgi:transglutaminase-like putative cysteine protease